MPALRCIRCNRPLLAYLVSTQTRHGLRGWGPHCAKLAGVEIKQERREPARIVRDGATRDWVQEAALC